VIETLWSANDFDWYKQSIDVAHRMRFRHRGSPERYPCRVISQWENDPDGPDCQMHTFVYQQTVKCESCGHETVVWPEQVM
jgi:hypothetical protein